MDSCAHLVPRPLPPHDTRLILQPVPKPASSGGLFACFKPHTQTDCCCDSGGPVQLLADVDCLEAYPMHTHNLARASLDQSAALKGAARKTTDYTVHGNKVRDSAATAAPHAICAFADARQLHGRQCSPPGAATPSRRPGRLC
jgi:hypothetical protein